VGIAEKDKEKTAFVLQEGLFEFNLSSAMPSKTEKIRNWPIPKDTQEVKQFLDLASYLPS